MNLNFFRHFSIVQQSFRTNEKRKNYSMVLPMAREKSKPWKNGSPRTRQSSTFQSVILFSPVPWLRFVITHNARTLTGKPIEYHSNSLCVYEITQLIYNAFGVSVNSTLGKNPMVYVCFICNNVKNKSTTADTKCTVQSIVCIVGSIIKTIYFHKIALFSIVISLIAIYLHDDLRFRQSHLIYLRYN